MRRILLILVLAVAAATAGCGSVVRVAYNNGDVAARFKAHEYFDLHGEQSDRLKAQIARFHAWHRREELPRYAALFGDASARLAAGLTRADVAWAIAAVRERYRVTVEQAADEFAPVAATMDPDNLAALERKLGLDRPAPQRYLHWLASLARLDLGTSHAYDTPIAELVAERLVVTLPLALLAMALTVVLALAAGVYAAAHHNRAGDLGVMAASQLGIAVPSFWFGILLVMLFAVQLSWFPSGGFPGWTEDEGGGPWDALQALILPAVALALVQAAILARFTRSAVLEVLREDFVRTARAKGLTRRAVLWGHVLRNAMIPVVTVMGLQFANLITGTMVVENVFLLPGHRPAAVPGHQQPRPAAGAGPGDADRRHGGDDQLRGGPALRGDRPAAQGGGTMRPEGLS